MGLTRRPGQAILAGVCAGVGADLQVPVVQVRIAFVVAALAGGIGVVAYLLMWLLAPAEPDPVSESRSRWPLIGVGAIAAGLLLWQLGTTTSLVIAAAAGGAALVWWPTARPDETTGGRLMRRSAGIGLLACAAVAFTAARVGVSSFAAAFGAVAVVLAGAALVASPFVVRLVRDRDRERTERLAARQRAEIAAHLHDSVLQTLALIQREHTDPDTVLRLARSEERGLRSWLYGNPIGTGEDVGLADQLQEAAAVVERSHASLIEVVTVGDVAGRTPTTDAVVAAAREAMLNAARHSGDTEPIRVFARMDDTEVSVFIRDRGCGFDPDQLPDDRAGVRDSIIGRVARLGGTTTIRSAPGAGTEVQIQMPL